MSEWITWSPCSVSCGMGSRSRERYVKQFPDDGSVCTLPTEETENCVVNEECCKVFFLLISAHTKSKFKVPLQFHWTLPLSFGLSSQQLPGYRVGWMGCLQCHLRCWQEEEGAHGKDASCRWLHLWSRGARSGEVHDARMSWVAACSWSQLSCHLLHFKSVENW